MATKLPKSIQTVLDLADWYEKFKPEQKTITVKPTILKEIRLRKYQGFYVVDGNVRLGKFLLTEA